MRVWSWVALPAGLMPGVTMRKPVPDASRIEAASSPEATTPSKPASLASIARCSTSSPGGMSVPCWIRSAGPRLVKHGDAEKLELAAAASTHRGIERLAVDGVHGEKLGAGARDRRCGALDRRLDVEKLRVEEHSAPARCELGGKRHAAGEHQLEPDLVDADAVAERLDQRPRLFGTRHVEGHDQPVAGAPHGATNLLAATASASTTPVSNFCCA